MKASKLSSHSKMEKRPPYWWDVAVAYNPLLLLNDCSVHQRGDQFSIKHHNFAKYSESTANYGKYVMQLTIDQKTWFRIPNWWQYLPWWNLPLVHNLESLADPSLLLIKVHPQHYLRVFEWLATPKKMYQIVISMTVIYKQHHYEKRMKTILNKLLQIRFQCW